MTNEAMELLRDILPKFSETLPYDSGDGRLRARIVVLLAQSKAAPQVEQAHSLESRKTENASSAPASAAPDSGMPDLSYGELMMMCEGHGTSKIYERFLALRAYALSLRERKGRSE